MILNGFFSENIYYKKCQKRIIPFHVFPPVCLSFRAFRFLYVLNICPYVSRKIDSDTQKDRLRFNWFEEESNISTLGRLSWDFIYIVVFYKNTLSIFSWLEKLYFTLSITTPEATLKNLTYL